MKASSRINLTLSNNYVKPFKMSEAPDESSGINRVKIILKDAFILYSFSINLAIKSIYNIHTHIYHFKLTIMMYYIISSLIPNLRIK